MQCRPTDAAPGVLFLQSCRDYHWATPSDDDGVFKVRGGCAVRGLDRPSVRVGCRLARSARNDRLYRDDQAGPEMSIVPWVVVVGHKRLLVNRFPDAMSSKLRNYTESLTLDFSLYRPSNPIHRSVSFSPVCNADRAHLANLRFCEDTLPTPTVTTASAK